MKRKTLTDTVLAAMLIAIGYVLPFFTGQVQQIGNMLLPMHLPVMIGGLVLGWYYGLAIGFVLPVTRSLIFGMPMLYPSAIAMSFELATYGACIGLIYFFLKKRGLFTVYVSLIASMIAGRLVWGAAMIVLTGVKGGSFAFSAFTAGAFFNAFPGIILQLILIPLLMLLLDKTKLVRFGSTRKR